MARLGKVVSNEATLSYTYEKALRALLDWDDEAVSDAAKALTSNEPIWIMRRAGLLAILCRYREAAELYQAALLSIRQKLLLSPKSAWLISLEGWADLFYQASYSILKGEFASFPENESECSLNTPGSITVMAIDNLPCELPRDASKGFGRDMLDYVIPLLIEGDKDGILAGARETGLDGKLCEKYKYLQEYVSGA